MAGREAESTVRIKRESRSKFVSETELSISNRYRPRAPSVLTLAGLLFVDELKDADEDVSCDYRNQTTWARRGAAFTLQLITHLAQKSSCHGAVLLVTLAVRRTEE